MERREIESELNEVERDLEDIARRAYIAASNLRSVAEFEKWMPLPAFARDIERIKFNAELTRTALAKTRALYKPAPGAAEDRREGAAQDKEGGVE